MWGIQSHISKNLISASYSIWRQLELTEVSINPLQSLRRPFIGEGEVDNHLIVCCHEDTRVWSTSFIYPTRAKDKGHLQKPSYRCLSNFFPVSLSRLRKKSCFLNWQKLFCHSNSYFKLSSQMIVGNISLNREVIVYLRGSYGDEQSNSIPECLNPS